MKLAFPSVIPSVIPSGDTVPASISRYLLPHERQVLTVRQHAAVFLGPLGAAVGGVIAAGILSGVADLSGDALLIMWLIWALLVLYALLKIFRWPITYFVVTPQRLLAVKGVIKRDVAMVPLNQVNDLMLRQTTTGRILGYGQFILDSPSQDPAMWRVNFLPYPEEVYLEVCGLMFPEQGDQVSD